MFVTAGSFSTRVRRCRPSARTRARCASWGRRPQRQPSTCWVIRSAKRTGCPTRHPDDKGIAAPKGSIAVERVAGSICLVPTEEGTRAAERAVPRTLGVDRGGGPYLPREPVRAQVAGEAHGLAGPAPPRAIGARDCRRVVAGPAGQPDARARVLRQAAGVAARVGGERARDRSVGGEPVTERQRPVAVPVVELLAEGDNDEATRASAAGPAATAGEDPGRHRPHVMRLGETGWGGTFGSRARVRRRRLLREVERDTLRPRAQAGDPPGTKVTRPDTRSARGGASERCPGGSRWVLGGAVRRGRLAGLSDDHGYT